MITTRLKRRRAPKMGLRESSAIRCDIHVQWVRGHECAVQGKGTGKFECFGRIEAHHVKTRGAGGGDEQVIPLCQFHHSQLDSPGWSSKKFNEVYGIDQAQIAAELWLLSPHGQRYRREQED